MLLSRRVPPSLAQSARLAIWPRRSWSRSFRYACLRLIRLRARPRHLALGAAAGMFVAILPIPGLQLLAAAALAWLVRGHSGAALMATFAANPVTYPLIWIASYLMGATILGTPTADATHDLDAFTGIVAQAFSAQSFSSPQSWLPAWIALWPILTTLLVGALPLAAVAAIAAYAGVSRILNRPARTAPLPPARRPISIRRQRRASNAQKREAHRLKSAA